MAISLGIYPIFRQTHILAAEIFKDNLSKSTGSSPWDGSRISPVEETGLRPKQVGSWTKGKDGKGAKVLDFLPGFAFIATEESQMKCFDLSGCELPQNLRGAAARATWQHPSSPVEGREGRSATGERIMSHCWDIAIDMVCFEPIIDRWVRFVYSTQHY